MDVTELYVWKMQINVTEKYNQICNQLSNHPWSSLGLNPNIKFDISALKLQLQESRDHFGISASWIIS